nr:TIGR03564 family F420-dependent LLM class oxidoreductase [Nocardia paucivorans]
MSPFAFDAADNAVTAAVESAREAADAGVRSLWFGQTFSFDAITMAALVAQAVPELEVGTSAVPIPARHPLLIGSQALTAQAAARGRFTLGLALGAPSITESAFGIPFDRPITRLREFLTALAGPLRNESAEFHGETVTAVTPIPGRVAGAEPAVPVLVAAMGPQAVRVTGESADGTLPFLVGPQALERHIVGPIGAAARRAGRSRPRVVAMVPGVVTSDPEAARAAAARQMAFYDTIPSYRRVIELSGASRAADLAVIGDERVVADRIAEYFAAGATDVVITQTDLTTPDDRRRTWRLLGELARTSTPATPSV